jgi:hypothetical protein
MVIRIIHRKDGVYDVYDRTSGKWLFSRTSADNVFSWLSWQQFVLIDFVDEEFLEVSS